MLAAWFCVHTGKSNMANANTNAELSKESVNPSEEFSNVPLEDVTVQFKGQKKVKVPRRVIHFSNGTLEEYSTDEEDEIVEDKVLPIDPKTLSWFPWMWYRVITVATGVLSVADSCGERLAWFFGITSPKYQYAIDEYNKMKREEEEERQMAEREKEAEEIRTAHTIASMEGATTILPENKAQIHKDTCSSTQVQVAQISVTKENTKF